MKKRREEASNSVDLFIQWKTYRQSLYFRADENEEIAAYLEVTFCMPSSEVSNEAIIRQSILRGIQSHEPKCSLTMEPKLRRPPSI